ncbi:hypothetical protein MCC10128_1987 [Bifidobacterium longum subsp. longum]|nr:hypothetical protein MCC10128_1987 [Bifidobacterium longum subsp. longum]
MRVQKEPRVVVEPGDDQRVRAVRDRPAREVRLPRLVRQRGLEPHVRGLRPFPRLRPDQSRVPEDPVDRGVRRRPDALALQPGGDGLRARVQTLGTQFTADRDDPFRDLRIGPVRDPSGTPGTRQQTRLALPLISALQFVRPLSAYFAAARGLGDRYATVDGIDDGLVAQELATRRPVDAGG